MVLTQAGTILAYSDVPNGIWYEAAVEDFVSAGYLDSSQARFRGGDNALRAEFVKLVVELNGGILGTAPSSPSFADVPVGAWYFGYMEEAAAEGWVRGDGNCYGTTPCYARPGANINRAESAALINRAFGLVGTGDAPQFVDNPSGQWYTNDIQVSADNCVLQGDSGRGTVRPGDNMNRAEMVVMLHRVDMGLQYPDCGSGETPSGEAGVDSVSTLSSTKVEVEFTVAVDRATAEDISNYDVDGLTVKSARLTNDDVVELEFTTAMTPGDDYSLTVHGMTAGGSEFDDSASFTGFREVPLSSGTLEVSLSPNSPLGDTIPRGATGIAMLSADFTASCDDDILVDGLTVIHEGQGTQADITNAWMSVNGARVSRTRIFDSEDQTAELRFSRPLLVEACETVTVDFMADYLSTAATNGRHNYVLELASDVTSNAQSVTGSFPVRGEVFEVAAVTSGTITATYRSVTPANVDVNDKDALVGKFELSANSTEDQTVYSLTLENTGTAGDGDFVDIFIRRTDGTALTGEVAQTVADYVTLTFDPPFTILEGDKVTLEVMADIVAGAADTIKLSFEETNDIFAVGSLYGYGVNGQLYGSQVSISTSPAVSTVTINAGELTIEIDGPVTEEYTPDADDVVLANIDFVTGGEDINVNEMYALIQGQTSTGATLGCVGGTAGDTIQENVEDVEIRNTVTGQTVDGVLLTSDAGTKAGSTYPASSCGATSTTTSTTAVYRFDDFVLRDSSRWQLRFDFIANIAVNGDRFRAYVCTADENDTTGCDFGGFATASTAYNFDAEGLSTGDTVTDIRPGEDINGNAMEVATANLSITERSLGSADTVVSNAKNVQLFRFEATAGKAEDVFLTQVVIRRDAGDLIDGQNYSLWVDTDDNGTVDTLLEGGQGCTGSSACGVVGTTTETVTFNDLAGGGYTIPAEQTVMFEVHADIAGSLTSTTLSVGFDDNAGVATTFGFIEAEEADDGSALSCISVGGTASTTSGCSASNIQIIVNTVTSKVFTLQNQGTLYVSKDSTPTRSRQLLGGALGEAILRLELRADDEPVDVTRIVVTQSGASANNISRFQLYRDGESTHFASATLDNCNNISTDFATGTSGTSNAQQTFCAVMESQQLVIQEGVRQDILVRPLLKSDEQGALSNSSGTTIADAQVGLIRALIINNTASNGLGITNSTTGTGAVTARGFYSSNVLLTNDNDTTQDGEVVVGSDTPTTDALIIGNKNDTVLAKIVSIEDVNPAADGTNVPVGTNKTIAEFKFTAATNNNTLNGLNKATLSGLVFNIASTNVSFTAANFDMYNKADQTQLVSCVAYDGNGNEHSVATGSGSFFVDCKRSNSDNASSSTFVNMEMDSGQSITLVLEADIASNQLSSTAGSSLTVSLNNFSDRAGGGYKSATSSSSHIQWSDTFLTGSVNLFNWVEFDQTEVTSTSYDL
jgi:hypothetical protein